MAKRGGSGGRGKRGGSSGRGGRGQRQMVGTRRIKLPKVPKIKTTKRPKTATQKTKQKAVARANRHKTPWGRLDATKKDLQKTPLGRRLIEIQKKYRKNKPDYFEDLIERFRTVQSP